MDCGWMDCGCLVPVLYVTMDAHGMFELVFRAHIGHEKGVRSNVTYLVCQIVANGMCVSITWDDPAVLIPKSILF